MTSRILLALPLLLLSLSLLGQNNLGDSVMQARKALAEVELLNSKEHPNYAEKAMELALLYYRQDLSDEPDSLVAQSLRVLGREYGEASNKFQSQLAKLEDEKACFLYSNYQIEKAKYADGENSLAHLKALCEQVKCYLTIVDYDAHDMAVVIAQQLEENHPEEDLTEFLAFLPKNYANWSCSNAPLNAKEAKTLKIYQTWLKQKHRIKPNDLFYKILAYYSIRPFWSKVSLPSITEVSFSPICS